MEQEDMFTGPKSTVIPPTPEVVLHGVTRILNPRIMECSEGGFIIVFDGIGLAAKSSWQEVLECIEDVGCKHMGLTKPEPVIPDTLRDGPTYRQSEHNRESWLHLHPYTALAAVFTTLLALFSIKIA